MSQPITVDRIEGDVAVLEIGGRTWDFPLAALPAGVKEGTRLSAVFQILPADTAAAEARLARLAQRGPKGDNIDL